MLEVTGLDVTLGGNHILKKVDLGVEDGEVVAILGPSGSGKSTLLKAIAGLVPVDSGTVSWDGNDLTGVPTHRRGFGLMFQGYALFPHLDVAGNVGFGLRMAGAEPAEIAHAVKAALEQVGLQGFDQRSVADLSGGEKQRVALARTLAPDPELVMLDEPLGALDRALRERLLTQTRQILDERAVTALVVTHDRDEATQLADRLALMREGRIVQTGTLEGMLQQPADDWVYEFLG